MAAFIVVSSDGVLLQNESERVGSMFLLQLHFYCTQAHARSINNVMMNKEITNV